MNLTCDESFAVVLKLFQFLLYFLNIGVYFVMYGNMISRINCFFNPGWDSTDIDRVIGGHIWLLINEIQDRPRGMSYLDIEDGCAIH